MLDTVAPPPLHPDHSSHSWSQYMEVTAGKSCLTYTPSLPVTRPACGVQLCFRVDWLFGYYYARKELRALPSPAAAALPSPAKQHLCAVTTREPCPPVDTTQTSGAQLCCCRVDCLVMCVRKDLIALLPSPAARALPSPAKQLLCSHKQGAMSNT